MDLVLPSCSLFSGCFLIPFFLSSSHASFVFWWFFFSGMLEFLFIFLMFIYCRLLLCGYYEAYIKHCITIHFKGDNNFKSIQNLYIFTHLHFFLSFVFSGPHLRHMKVPRLGVQSELQLPAYARATAMPDPSHVCDLHHSSWQCRIPKPLRKARDWTHNVMVPSWICFCCATMGTPTFTFLMLQFTSIYIMCL